MSDVDAQTSGMPALVAVLPNHRIDDAYRAKYHNSPYLDPMLGARARAATVKVIPNRA